VRTTLKVLLTVLIMAAQGVVFFYAGAYVGDRHATRVISDECVDLFIEHFDRYHLEYPLEPPVEPDAI
jgi:hypothetical protein